MTARKKKAAGPVGADGRSGPPPLKDSAAEAIAHFLATLDGEACIDLYDMVLHQIEEPLLKRSARLHTAQPKPCCRDARPKPRHLAQKASSARLASGARNRSAQEKIPPVKHSPR